MRLPEARARGRATLEGVSELLERHRGLIALSGRESARVLKLWTQTIAAPVLSSMLFILVFGLSLGGRIKQIGGVDYEVFIVPGLITMAMAQAAYSNNSSSVFQARSDRYLHDVLSAPMRAWEVNVGLSLGGVVRALAIGGALLAIAAPVTGVPVRQPLVLVVALALVLVLFSSLGVLVGVYARDVGPGGLRQQHRHPAAELPRRGLLLGRPAAVAVAGDLAPQPDLLPHERRALRLPRDRATCRSGSRSR